MEESISGFKLRGQWGDVVEHGERITQALREAHAGDDYRESFHEWNEWRPKSHERLSEDVSQKTAEQASVDEGAGEQAGKDAEDDLQTAGEKLSESYENVEEGDPDTAVERWSESIDHVVRAADTASRKALRALEGTVYRKVMTQVAPYYFDNELISANIQRSTRGEQVEFVFEVNINDDGLKEEVSQRLQEYDESIDRWHVDTERETESIEAAEGVELPEGESEESTRSTTN
jgi:hypothetical protein